MDVTEYRADGYAADVLRPGTIFHKIESCRQRREHQTPAAMAWACCMNVDNSPREQNERLRFDYATLRTGFFVLLICIADSHWARVAEGGFQSGKQGRDTF